MNRNSYIQRTSDSHKFQRRSMSPIQYINTQQYKNKIREKEIKVNFGYVFQNKLEKACIKKRGLFSPKVLTQKPQNIFLDKTQTHDSSQNSFLKNTQLFSSSKIPGKFTSDQASDLQILRNLDEEDQFLQGEINIHSQLYVAQKKIFEYESQLQKKNIKIEEQQQSLKQMQYRHAEALKKLKFYEAQLQKMNIALIMQQRENQNQRKVIKKLRAVNQLNRDRIFSKQSLRKIRNREEDNLFSLSPDKADE